MAIGYACLTVGVEGVNYKTCRKENADEKTLKEIISVNLTSLDRMLDYNIENGIKMMRITSDIIPFGSHPVNQVKWWEIYENELFLLGKKAKDNGIRLSMHPGQYTVLNSPGEEVVKKAAEDLLYHARFLDSLGLDQSGKMILHIGGAYGNKKEALNRFAENYKKLDERIKNRLVIENDDKIFNIEEVLDLGLALKVPVIYDNLHNATNPSGEETDKYWIEKVSKTWTAKDGRQKIHYSQQAEDKKPGSHSQTINAKIFSDFYKEVGGDKIDIMLEVKDKNLSAVKAINAVERSDITALEKEWARYKYLVLEHSPLIYNEIRELLKDKNAYPVLEFYDLIDKALSHPAASGQIVNAAQHVWGYFDKLADKKTHDKVSRMIDKVAGGSKAGQLKKTLWSLAKEYNQKYLLESLYFKDIL
ncbi:UV DNA damage repair endonuclease UvsE [Treponema parvum]|uniref:UV DNA damage repair endonuclease UvsE n=1 Tax=Treponema parvum TaxID=138851 RepID=A0A975IDV3_9SPIR|nr:UV DNA damage repair endonuclease UvsE [Treponema parvum]QTQ12599.1 UV DNA damage repair endonuclease UvsE [Treponema parvum]